jgi:beta-mannosidase
MSSSADASHAHDPVGAPQRGDLLTPIREGWEAAASAPGRFSRPDELEGLHWRPARVPGTAAGALRAAGEWREGDDRDLDAEDWWFRTSFNAEAESSDEQVLLSLGGIATLSEVYLNGELVLESDSMFHAHQVDVGGRVRGVNQLAICCRALAPRLRERRRPRARWRTRLVAEGNLRFFRTMLLGRAPGFAPGPAAVGPWREILLERRRGLVVEDARLLPRVEGSEGRIAVHVHLRPLAGRVTSAVLELSGATGTHSAALSIAENAGTFEASGELAVEAVALWWPHTHGEPALYAARLAVSADDATVDLDLGRVGFRSLAPGPSPAHDPLEDGLDFHVNGVRVFARGAVWTPLDIVSLGASTPALRSALEQVRAAGMNIVRIPGTSAYEETAFHDLCDELGILLWQDFMFANLDYPIADERFRASVEAEARQLARRLRGRPSVAVLCGNSEIEQQVAMLGLDPALGRGELFGELLPAIAREEGLDATYLPSAPCGGDQPFRPNRGVANYYGVGGYRRPLEDARRAEVRFAAECLAFANVPNETAIEQMMPQAPANMVVHHPRWKAGTPRDAGTGWDFEDVRDHYLALLYALDPSELRRVDHERYLELSRLVTGEVMAEVFGEWRRAASPCGGGIVLWLRDLALGAGWGVIDALGEPKVAYHHLRRALAPRAVWLTDEGLAGVVAHVANDAPTPLHANLRAAVYRDFEQRLDQAEEAIEVEPHGNRQWNVETLLGRFADAAWAYRFGPPQQDVIVVSLEAAGGQARPLISQAMLFPAGRPTTVETAERLGLGANAQPLPDGRVRLHVHSSRLAYGVRARVPGFIALEDSISVEPRSERIVELAPRTPDAIFAGGALSAVNLRGEVLISSEVEEREPSSSRVESPAA